MYDQETRGDRDMHVSFGAEAASCGDAASSDLYIVENWGGALLCGLPDDAACMGGHPTALIVCLSVSLCLVTSKLCMWWASRGKLGSRGHWRWMEWMHACLM